MKRTNTYSRLAKTAVLAAFVGLPLIHQAAADENDYPMMQPGSHYGYGMGPGMMGGYGGGYGMGPGMMGGYGAAGALNLSDKQRGQINEISDNERKQHWAVMGKMLDVQTKLRDLYTQDTPDPKKVGAVYGEIAKHQQQMIETHVQAQNQMQNVLTKEQREQLQQSRRGGWGPGAGPRGGMMGR